MLLSKNKIRACLLALTACLVPTSMMADEPQLFLSRFQDAQKPPAKAPPAQPDEETPLPKATDKPKAEATPAPAKQPDGVARVHSAAVCVPNQTAGCDKNGYNWNGLNCEPNECFVNGCNLGDCYGSMQEGMICAGRPYTFGDLGRDICSAKCRFRNCFGFDNCHGGGAVHAWWYEQQFRTQCRRAYRNRALSAWLHNKFNYLYPSGCCGEGCPPVGRYRRVYATDPDYYDSRDQQLYASPVSGLPTAIPLAPGVRYQYNYSWGYPGSRLTPISTFRPSGR
jgi:hypothetical protein